MKKILLLVLAMLTCGMTSVWADSETTYYPTLDVNFRTADGNTDWQSGYPKDASAAGNTVFEGNYQAGLFVIQQYKVDNLANVTKITLTLTAGSGVDATDLRIFPNNTWSASSEISAIIPTVTELVGVAPRATEGTATTPLVKAAKVADSDPAKASFTISGTALTALKNAAAADGTFSVLITNNKYTENSSRKFQSSNSANAEANRPTLVASAPAQTVLNKTTGVGYATLNDAFADLGDQDTELQISDDQVLTSRLTWSKAHKLTITATKQITIKGHNNQMWFLVNAAGAELEIGSTSNAIVLNGQNKTMDYDVTKYENSSKITLTNVVFEDFNLNNKGHLVGSNNYEGLITIDAVELINCKNPADGFINKQRVTNDRLVLKNYLTIQPDCEGTTIYAASETKTSGTTGRIKVDDDSFSVSGQPITIEWPGTKKEDIVVVIGTTEANASKFKLTDSEWNLTRTAWGDLKMAAATGINVVENAQSVSGDNIDVVYDLQGRRVTGQMGKGIYIVNGKKVVNLR